MSSVRRIASCIYHRTLSKFFYHVKLNVYWIKLPYKIRALRHKKTVRVLFVISEAASWKSEMLYTTMLLHSRFQPIIGISTSSAPWGAKETLVAYLKEKEYHYYDLDECLDSIDKIAPDIIFYYKPYSDCYSKGHFFDKNLKYIFCGLDYCFEATRHAAHIEKEYFDYCWKFFVENKEIAERRTEILGYRARNTIITGVPMQDILLRPKEAFTDPWKDKSGKKRIIYAPHHSFEGTNGDGIEFATFLLYAEDMVRIAKEYKDKITIAFKPHPNLYMKLLKIWGQEKTDAYYDQWKSMDNTQLETGEYVGLFKYSDAIIHDCASFIVEYLYSDNPGLYLVAKSNNLDEMFKFVRDGYECYEHGYNVADIEAFIDRVIKGIDAKKEQREKYVISNLIPPNGKTACDNIINSILFDE